MDQSANDQRLYQMSYKEILRDKVIDLLEPLTNEKIQKYFKEVNQSPDEMKAMNEAFEIVGELFLGNSEAINRINELLNDTEANEPRAMIS